MKTRQFQKQYLTGYSKESLTYTISGQQDDKVMVLSQNVKHLLGWPCCGSRSLVVTVNTTGPGHYWLHDRYPPCTDRTLLLLLFYTRYYFKTSFSKQPNTFSLRAIKVFSTYLHICLNSTFYIIFTKSFDWNHDSPIHISIIIAS